MLLPKNLRLNLNFSSLNKVHQMRVTFLTFVFEVPSQGKGYLILLRGSFLETEPSETQLATRG